MTLAAWTGPAAGAAESDAELARGDRIEELERKVEVLTDELARLRADRAVPEGEDELESWQGLGPALSRIYTLGQGLSIGGYAEGNYRGFVGDGSKDSVNRADMLRLVLYTGYKFNEHLVFNSEIEFEHATTSDETEEVLGNGTGEVSVEFAALDYLWRDDLNVRGGLVLVPMGFLNEYHEPPFFHGVSRPVVETRIIPTTWRENGVGVYGNLGESIQYRGYLMTGLDAQGLEPDSLRDARSSGSRARAEDPAGVLRVDWTPFQGALLGGSFYFGGIDQNRDDFGEDTLALWELHGQLLWRGFELRALYTQAAIDGAGRITRALQAEDDLDSDEAIANSWLGAYVEAAYDVMPWIAPRSDLYLAPFFRAEWVNTQRDVPSGFASDDSYKTWVFTPGLGFKPHPNVVLKVDYRVFSPREGDQANEVELGFGLAF